MEVARRIGHGATDRATAWVGLTIVALVGVFYALSLREGHAWGDDFALYILHARNIAAGHSYGDTGYIFNPHSPQVSPPTYPPIFPLLLAPVYKAWGLSLPALKAVPLCLFLGFLLCCWFGFSRFLPLGYCAGLVLVLGFHPFFWSFKDHIVSDFPFLFFLFLSLFAIDRSGSATRQWGGIRNGVLVGLLIYLAYGTRSVGLTLIPSLIALDLIQKRKLRLRTAVAVAVFALFGFLQGWLVHNDRGYVTQIQGHYVETIKHNLVAYSEAFFDIWQTGWDKRVRAVFVGTLALFALAGFSLRVRSRTSILEPFMLIYVLAILVWPAYQGGRFLLPLVPLFLFYSCVASHQLIGAYSRVCERGVAAGLVAGFGLFCTSGYALADFGPIPEGIVNQGATDCFAFVRTRTSADDVFIFRKPRALALCTQRHAAAYHVAPDDNLWNYFREIHATYVIVGLSSAREFATDQSFLLPFVLKYPGRFREVFANSHFKVYQICQ